MWSRTEASVVDFPLPVTPVTRTRPLTSLAMVSSTLGRFNSSKVCIFMGMTLNTMPTAPLCWNMLTLNLPSPGTLYAMSSWWYSRKCSFCTSFITRIAALAISSGASLSWFLTGTSWPCTRRIGGTPALRCTSEALLLTAILRIELKSMSAIDYSSVVFIP